MDSHCLPSVLCAATATQAPPLLLICEMSYIVIYPASLSLSHEPLKERALSCHFSSLDPITRSLSV